MPLRPNARIPIILSAAAVVAATPVARADEAYLCGPDKVVYVKADELEAKKHSDPCIAGYYGLTVEQPKQSEKSNVVAVPEPIARSEDHAPVEFKSLTASEVPEHKRQRFDRTALVTAPVASPGTDYRNVRVINAGPDDAQWFRHAR